MQSALPISWTVTHIKKSTKWIRREVDQEISCRRVLFSVCRGIQTYLVRNVKERNFGPPKNSRNILHHFVGSWNQDLKSFNMQTIKTETCFLFAVALWPEEFLVSWEVFESGSVSECDFCFSFQEPHLNNWARNAWIQMLLSSLCWWSN